MFGSLLNAFLISFREGIEAALIVMTVLVVLKKRGDLHMRNVAFWAIGTAIAACSYLAYRLGSIALVNNPELEVALYGIAAITVVTMVIWMMRSGKFMSKEIEQKIDTHRKKTVVWAAIGLFVFVFFMVAREGFELSLFLLAFGAGINGYAYVVAMILGLAAAVGVGYALSRGILRVNIGKFLQATAFVLLVLVVQLVLDFFHEGIESGIVPEPSSQSIVNSIDYLHDTPIFSYIAIGAFLLIIGYFMMKSFSARKLAIGSK